MENELKIVKYIKKHGLGKTVSDFKLKVREYPSKILLKYDQIASLMGEPIVQEARGLILEKDSWDVLSFAFEKFFNAAEGHAAKIDWDTAYIYEKLDGSLINLYYDWNKETWFAATTGTAEGEGEVNNKLGTTFNDLFWDTINKDYFSPFFDSFIEGLNKDYTYMFELTTPYNIVVKPHGTSTATLLGVRDRTTLKEKGYDDLSLIADDLGIPLVKVFNVNQPNVGVLIKTFDGMPFSEEGYVVCDGDFNRIKIKNPAYVSAHHLKGKMGCHHIMGIIKSNEIDEFIATFKEREEEIRQLESGYISLREKLESIWESLNDKRPKNITPKEKKRFAMCIFSTLTNENTSLVDNLKVFSGLFFSLNEGKVDSVNEYLMNYDDKKLYHMIIK